MDNVQKTAFTDYNAPSSEPFRLVNFFFPEIEIVYLFVKGIEKVQWRGFSCKLCVFRNTVWLHVCLDTGTCSGVLQLHLILLSRASVGHCPRTDV
jgi:hypothetical protein